MSAGELFQRIAPIEAGEAAETVEGGWRIMNYEL
jgi:hypothetical protein